MATPAKINSLIILLIKEKPVKKKTENNIDFKPSYEINIEDNIL